MEMIHICEIGWESGLVKRTIRGPSLAGGGLGSETVCNDDIDKTLVIILKRLCHANLIVTTVSPRRAHEATTEYSNNPFMRSK